jgi:5-methylcytosine-specific restriction endonuclease McrA
VPRGQKKEHRLNPEGVEERQCSDCQAWHQLDNFHMHGRFRSNMCKPCERTHARENARQNAEIHRQRAKAYAKANPERVKAALERWRANNPERLAEHNRSPKKRERGREYMQHKRAASPEEYRAAAREYDHRTGKGAEKAARRRALQMGAEIDHTGRNAIIKRDGRSCYLCGLLVKWREVTLDHVLPLSRGGSHTAENLRVACGPCNFSKQHRTVEEYRAYLLTKQLII